MKTEIGVIPALITPLNEDETIDVPSLENLINWMLSYDLKGLFVGGTMGEGIALRDSQRAILFRESVRIVNGRVPVLANVSEIKHKKGARQCNNGRGSKSRRRRGDSPHGVSQPDPGRNFPIHEGFGGKFGGAGLVLRKPLCHANHQRF